LSSGEHIQIVHKTAQKFFSIKFKPKFLKVV